MWPVARLTSLALCVLTFAQANARDGEGAHRCVGEALARAEMDEARATSFPRIYLTSIDSPFSSPAV